ncbi:Putative OsmC-like protein [Candidatus Phycorickettsia trachydisci]|uniref:OsmC-like protein n=2 Tax=Candidatus Phycorickettsia trachydisci TaxID=2115978 RepID=A0A2P1PA69_9RICK|nr:Putative OsmC-like protein [Candidatus Phycorickettsia trachydisci]
MMIQQSDLKKKEILITSVNDVGPFAFSVKTANHSIMADEPKDIGGSDSGMNPFDLLAASLGTCTAMTLQFYAKRKNLELGQFQVKISIIHTPIQGTNENSHIFTCDIIFEEAKTPELIQKFKEIAEKCPVHKAISHNKISILTNVI